MDCSPLSGLTNGSGVAGNGDDSVRVRTLKVAWTAIPTTSMVNELRFSWYHGPRSR